MQKATRMLLLLFAFAVPWEYSLDFGEPWGNIARVVGLALLLVCIPAALAKGRLRNPGPLQWMAGLLFLWLCCTAFWTVDLETTLERLRGDAQVMMIAWVAWEWLESAEDLRDMVRAMLAGSWVLALLTIADAFAAHGADAAQLRFAAVGQDPNDVARFLDFSFPAAALLLDWNDALVWRILSIGYFPLGIAAVLLTASRGGFLTALVALTGCALLLFRRPARGMIWAGLAVALFGVGVWLTIPDETVQRLATIPAQIAGGDMNQRLNIWEAGWRAFAAAPLLGHGAGSFVMAAGVAEGDTAHNTALSLAVEAGMIGVGLMTALLVMLLRSAWSVCGSLRIALLSWMAVWGVASIAGTLAESRLTWLIFALIAVAGRISQEGKVEIGTRAAPEGGEARRGAGMAGLAARCLQLPVAPVMLVLARVQRNRENGR